MSGWRPFNISFWSRGVQKPGRGYEYVVEKQEQERHYPGTFPVPAKEVQRLRDSEDERVDALTQVHVVTLELPRLSEIDGRHNVSAFYNTECVASERLRPEDNLMGLQATLCEKLGCSLGQLKLVKEYASEEDPPLDPSRSVKSIRQGEAAEEVAAALSDEAEQEEDAPKDVQYGIKSTFIHVAEPTQLKPMSKSFPAGGCKREPLLEQERPPGIPSDEEAGSEVQDDRVGKEPMYVKQSMTQASSSFGQAASGTSVRTSGADSLSIASLHSASTTSHEPSVKNMVSCKTVNSYGDASFPLQPSLRGMVSCKTLNSYGDASFPLQPALGSCGPGGACGGPALSPDAGSYGPQVYGGPAYPPTAPSSFPPVAEGMPLDARQTGGLPHDYPNPYGYPHVQPMPIGYMPMAYPGFHPSMAPMTCLPWQMMPQPMAPDPYMAADQQGQVGAVYQGDEQAAAATAPAASAPSVGGDSGGNLRPRTALAPASKPSKHKTAMRQIDKSNTVYDRDTNVNTSEEDRYKAFRAAEPKHIRQIARQQKCRKKGDLGPCNCKGCCVRVQDMIKLAGQKGDEHMQCHICSAFQGFITEDVGDPYAIFVITCMVECVPESTAKFIAEELRSFGTDAATHKYGCRILCKILEQEWEGPEAMGLMDEVLLKAKELKFKKYATFVMQTVLEKKRTDEQYRSVVEALVGQEPPHDLVTVTSVRDPKSSDEPDESIFVIAKALKHCYPDDRHAIAKELLDNSAGGPSLAEKLTQRKYGCILLKRLLLLGGEYSKAVEDQLQEIFEKKSNDADAQRQLRDKLKNINNSKGDADSSDCDGEEQKTVGAIVDALLERVSSP